jgi:hypothetical protein
MIQKKRSMIRNAGKSHAIDPTHEKLSKGKRECYDTEL